MLNKFKAIDGFNKNIIIVFLSSSLLNFINLLYQLLIAHRLSLADFAAFNSLLSIYMVISMPLASLQTAIAKYSAEFNARGETEKIKFLLSGILKKSLSLAALTFIIFCLASIFIVDKLQINSRPSGYLLAVLLALAWIMPV
ncbi:MAG TPA: hypothetical protein VI976_03865, partial [Candidatus Omnitrophota bacterium]|nr:hypothetical protein [Candidatus Omnitrophota bacterium]